MHERMYRKNGAGKRFRNWNTQQHESVTNSIIDTIRGLGDRGEASSYLQSEFLDKYCDESLVSAETRRANAIAKWHDTENNNAITNRLIMDRDPGYNVLPRVTYSRFVRFVRRVIRDILGPLHDEVVLGSFSGGASTSRPRTSSLPAMKFTGMADTTSAAARYMENIHYNAPLLRQYGFGYFLNEVSGAVLFTVPKKTDIDRCACKEPDVNMFLQKGVGAHIRRRLRRHGINLNDQSVNRRLAREGSLDSSLSTLDLSAASDSVTIELVNLLLPKEWFLYLNDIRSQTIVIDGETYRTELFSTMGNGFTFELESLLFYALMRAVAYFEGVPGIISVYGDDIIIPSGMSDLAIFVLGEFGFTVNVKKSHTTGYFRESCGGHYHRGEDITPFYLKRRISVLTDVIRLANQLRRWAFADPFRRFEISNLYEIWRAIACLVPRDLWGGHDYSVDTQLVSPPVGKNMRLIRISEPVKVPQVGSYLFWQNTNWNRGDSVNESQPPISTNQICRKRPSKPGAPVCEEFFLEEILAFPGPC